MLTMSHDKACDTFTISHNRALLHTLTIYCQPHCNTPCRIHTTLNKIMNTFIKATCTLIDNPLFRQVGDKMVVLSKIPRASGTMLPGSMPQFREPPLSIIGADYQTIANHRTEETMTTAQGHCYCCQVSLVDKMSIRAKRSHPETSESSSQDSSSDNDDSSNNRFGRGGRVPRGFGGGMGGRKPVSVNTAGVSGKTCMGPPVGNRVLQPQPSPSNSGLFKSAAMFQASTSPLVGESPVVLSSEASPSIRGSGESPLDEESSIPSTLSEQSTRGESSEPGLSRSTGAEPSTSDNKQSTMSLPLPPKEGENCAKSQPDVKSIMSPPVGVPAGSSNVLPPTRPMPPGRPPSSSPPGGRTGLPSIKPNASRMRQKQLEMLKRYEERIKGQKAKESSSTASSTNTCCHGAGGPCKALYPQQKRVLHPMYVHCLDLSQVAATRTATWLPLTDYGVQNAPDETLFYSLVEGRGELIMFGGIQTDVNNMRRPIHSGHVVSNMVYFLNPKKLLR